VFGDEELQKCFQYLVGKMLYKEALPKDFITAEEFASDLLGFEEYEEGDDEEEEGEAGANGVQDVARESGMGGMGGVNEVIPEEDGF